MTHPHLTAPALRTCHADLLRRWRRERDTHRRRQRTATRAGQPEQARESLIEALICAWKLEGVRELTTLLREEYTCHVITE